MIQNPVLTGFNPDPSIVRVGEDFYIATSTFQWFPGVNLHHSKDLIHWEHIGYALTRRSQLDMVGNPDSGGIWAPDLSYHDGTFHLIYTDVKVWRGAFEDAHNYLVTAQDIRGPWSEPIYLNSSGFDPSLFHDEDGRKWFVNALWDHRAGRNPFAGIVLQEYSPKEERLVGPIKNIFKGTDIALTEAPHLYKRDGMYYLMTAEGGTEYEHAVTVARSRDLFGPYEVDPNNPMLTSVNNPELELQKAGHASLVETQNGDWYLAHLCGRPLPSDDPAERFCNLGRETALQKVEWSEDGWLRVEGGGNEPKASVPSSLPEHTFDAPPERVDFDADTLPIAFQSPRIPFDESWGSLTERPGYLRLRGRESLSSVHRQSTLARRLQAFRAEAETSVEFDPVSFQQMAGLLCVYDTRNYVYLYLTHHDDDTLALGILHADQGETKDVLADPVLIRRGAPVFLKAVFDYNDIRLHYKAESDWQAVGPTFAAKQLSDEYDGLGFTGTFVGVNVQDLSGRKAHADFDFFAYKEV